LIKSQRIAVSVAFLAFGAACTTWVPRLPALKDHLHLTDGQVGLALLAYAVGAVVGAAAARLVLARGARAFVQAGTVALCVALIGPGLAADFTQLFASLLLIGATAGFIDVLENAQAAELERKAGRPLINGFHGFWSLGAIIGSVSAGAAAYAGVTPLVQFIAVGGIVVVATAWILRDLPDTLDLLAISVEAGMGFEGALEVVCQNFTSPLADEFSRTLREMELGLPRRDAFQNLKRRTEVPELSNFVLALLQADALGIPIGRVLKTQAAEMRNKRRQWAREKAGKLPVKIMFPLVCFIFPAILVIVLGPAGSSIGKAFR